MKYIRISHPVSVHVFLLQLTEVRVSQRLLHRYSSTWIQIQHLQAEVKTSIVKVFEVTLGVYSFEFRETRLEIGKIFSIKLYLRMPLH